MLFIDPLPVRFETPSEESGHHGPGHCLANPEKIRAEPRFAPVPINRILVEISHGVLHATVPAIKVLADIQDDFRVGVGFDEFGCEFCCE